MEHLPSGYPTFVRFPNIAKPASVEEVDPDNLSARFGAGVKIRRITVGLTDDPVTTGIGRRLPWWHDYLDRHFDGTSTAAELVGAREASAHYSTGSFSTALGK